MFDLATLARLKELERSIHPVLPASEYPDEAMGQSMKEHLRESQYLDEGIRQWWLTERGWLREPVAVSRSTGPVAWDRILRPVGKFLVSWFHGPRSRSEPVTGRRVGGQESDMTMRPGIVGPTP